MRAHVLFLLFTATLSAQSFTSGGKSGTPVHRPNRIAPLHVGRIQPRTRLVLNIGDRRGFQCRCVAMKFQSPKRKAAPKYGANRGCACSLPCRRVPYFAGGTLYTLRQWGPAESKER